MQQLTYRATQGHQPWDEKEKSMSATIIQPKNLLINSLNMEAQRRLLPHLELVKLKQGSVIGESGDVMKNVYFPIDSIISLMFVTGEDGTTETSLVGKEGFVGLALLIGGENISSRAVVQRSGYAYRISLKKCKEELERNGNLRELMQSYLQSLLSKTEEPVGNDEHNSARSQLQNSLLSMLDLLSTPAVTPSETTEANLISEPNTDLNAKGKLQRLEMIKASPENIKPVDKADHTNTTGALFPLEITQPESLIPQAYSHHTYAYRHSA